MSKRARRMNRRETAEAAQGAIVAANDNRGVTAFSFGDPEPVNSRATMLDMLECYHNQRWYEPPISLDGLARTFRASPHHSSAIILTPAAPPPHRGGGSIERENPTCH